jgi:hypothetical protein
MRKDNNHCGVRKKNLLVAQLDLIIEYKISPIFFQFSFYFFLISSIIKVDLSVNKPVQLDDFETDQINFFIEIGIECF